MMQKVKEYVRNPFSCLNLRSKKQYYVEFHSIHAFKSVAKF